MRKVAIIGTGPSGLAAAKALAEHQIEPVVLEGALNIGGMWAGEGRGAWSSDMRTNLSHYSCAFSDFPWAPGSDVFPVRSEIIRIPHRLCRRIQPAQIHAFRRASDERAGDRAARLAARYGAWWQAETGRLRRCDHCDGTSYSVPYTPKFRGARPVPGRSPPRRSMRFVRRQSPRLHRKARARGRRSILRRRDRLPDRALCCHGDCQPAASDVVYPPFRHGAAGWHAATLRTWCSSIAARTTGCCVSRICFWPNSVATRARSRRNLRLRQVESADGYGVTDHFLRDVERGRHSGEADRYAAASTSAA